MILPRNSVEKNGYPGRALGLSLLLASFGSNYCFATKKTDPLNGGHPLGLLGR